MFFWSSYVGTCIHRCVAFGQLLDREAKRERILEARMREIRLKQRQAEEGSPVASLSELDAAVGDKDLAEAALEYLSQVKKEQGSMM